MSKFYIFLWLRWIVRISVLSITLALFFSLLVTLYMYINQDLPELTPKVTDALFNITLFWFPLFWSATLLFSLFRSLKYIFNSCIEGYKLQLLTCDMKEIIEFIGYGDLVKVWRKWFMLIIWLVGSQMILAVVFTSIFTNYGGVFEWFNIYWLFGFVLLSGYLSFILLASRCKRVKVVKC